MATPSSTSSICFTQMSVSSRDSESHSGAADHNQLEDSSSLTSKRQHCRPRSPPAGTRDISRPNNEHVNKILRQYEDKGVSDRKKISQLLADEHGIYMSEVTVAKRRRTPNCTIRADALTNISDVKKRFCIWKHRDASYKGLRRSRGIERAVKGAYDMHITEEYISQALEGIDEGKMGPLGEWRIEIYQLLSELDLCLDYQRYVDWRLGIYIITLCDLDRNVWEIVSLDQAVDKISRVQPNYLIIKGAPEELSPGFNETMRGWEEKKNSYNAAGWDIRYRYITCCLGETLEIGKRIKMDELCEGLDKVISMDKSADRAEDVWDHLYPSKCWFDILDLSDVWDYFEKLLPLWKKQFTFTDTEK
ncbi:hypothetical protein M422DRAFT_239816 [Sphaerobolus stellatus SS14]|nr:hypothetical protein M422DRAFT_239816 [Sphaerobolus stellatus SS14]